MNGHTLTRDEINLLAAARNAGSQSPDPHSPEFIGPDFDYTGGEFDYGSDPAGEIVTITQAQYDDLRGLVSDLQVIIEQFKQRDHAALAEWQQNPWGRWLQFGTSSAYFQAAQDLRWALVSHPSVKDLK